MLTLVRLSACDELGGLIAGGENLVPKDRVTVDSARKIAIELITSLPLLGVEGALPAPATSGSSSS